MYQRTRESVLKQSKLARMVLTRTRPPGLLSQSKNQKTSVFAEITPEFPDMLQV